MSCCLSEKILAESPGKKQRHAKHNKTTTRQTWTWPVGFIILIYRYLKHNKISSYWKRGKNFDANAEATLNSLRVVGPCWRVKNRSWSSCCTAEEHTVESFVQSLCVRLDEKSSQHIGWSETSFIIPVKKLLVPVAHDHNIITILSQYYHNIITILSQYYHNIITILSQYYHNIITILSQYPLKDGDILYYSVITIYLQPFC